MTNNKNYVVICFDAPDGAGKSSLINLTANLLQHKGYQVIVYKDFSSKDPNSISSKIRKLILHDLDSINDLNPNIFLYLCSAVRLDMIDQINKDIKESENSEIPLVILLDRYVFSTLCYQTIQGADTELISDVIRNAVSLLKPDLTLIINTNLEIIRQRKSNIEDTIEAYFEDKFTALQNLYNDPLNIFQHLTNKLVRIDNNGTYEETKMSIWNNIKDILNIQREDTEIIFTEEITENNFPLIRKAFEWIIYDIGARNREESVIYKLRLTKQDFIDLEYNLSLLTEKQLETLCIGSYDDIEYNEMRAVKNFNYRFCSRLLDIWYNSFQSERVSGDKYHEL
jgi:dTMP kinase